MQLFGFEIKKRNEEPATVSFAPKPNEDGAMVVQAGGIYGTYVDMDGSIRTETELVTRYRELSNHPELELAIDDIINEAMVGDSQDSPVEINLDDLEQPDRIKDLITEEFKNILNLLEFNDYSYDIFKKWYVDGRLYYHLIVDPKDLRAGIKELRYIDPRNIRKVREQKKKKTESGVPVVQDGGILRLQQQGLH